MGLCSVFVKGAQQGSVTTPLRCGGIFKNDSIASLLTNLSVQECRKSAFGEIADKSL